MNLAMAMQRGGWQTTPPIQLTRLRRRIEINRLNTITGILTRAGYRSVFNYYRRSRSQIRLRGADFWNFPPEQLKYHGWCSAQMPGFTCFTAQSDPASGPGQDSLSAVWAFSPHRYEKPIFNRNASGNLLAPEKYASQFDGTGSTARTPSGTYNGVNHTWLRGENPAFLGSISTNQRDRFQLLFDVRGFVSNLLPDLELQPHPTLYCAERSQLLR